MLDNVAYARCFNSEQQQTLLMQGASMLAENRFALIVVDSATALFRGEFVGRGELADRQQLLGKFLRVRTILGLASYTVPYHSLTTSPFPSGAAVDSSS